MIVGIVNPRLEATVLLRIVGPAGQLGITAVIDTGYNGSLTLPLSAITALGLPHITARNVVLGDSTQRLCDYYAAALEWDGQPRQIPVLCLEGDCLLGTSLLAGFSLLAEFNTGGPVSINRLP